MKKQELKAFAEDSPGQAGYQQGHLPGLGGGPVGPQGATGSVAG